MTSRGYDAAGDTASYSNLTFTYNDRGRMRAVKVGSTSTSYVYNAVGQLIKKTVGITTTLLMYDEAGHLLGEYTSSGGLIQETIWMGDIPVATLRRAGQCDVESVNLVILGTNTPQPPVELSSKKYFVSPVRPQEFTERLLGALDWI